MTLVTASTGTSSRTGPGAGRRSTRIRSSSAERGMPAGSRTADYDFDLPPELIAQTPAERRDRSRLMVVNRQAGTISHYTFADLPGFLSAGDALVLNSSKVIRARLLGTRDSGAPAEVLLIKSLGAGRYEAMVHPGGKLKPGRRISVSPPDSTTRSRSSWRSVGLASAAMTAASAKARKAAPRLRRNSRRTHRTAATAASSRCSAPITRAPRRRP